MSETLPVWNITPEDEEAAEAADYADLLDNITGNGEALADVLSAFFAPLREKLPPQLAEAVTLNYALMLLARGGVSAVEYRSDDAP